MNAEKRPMRLSIRACITTCVALAALATSIACSKSPDASRNSAADMGDTSGCGAMADGTYCGDMVGGDEDTLYQCAGGNLSMVQACAKGCLINTDGNDSCATGCEGAGDGTYCGGAAVDGDQGTLYQCSGGDLSTVQVCDNGCAAGAPGSDSCAGPGSSAPSSGDDAGDDGGEGGNSGDDGGCGDDGGDGGTGF